MLPFFSIFPALFPPGRFLIEIHLLCVIGKGNDMMLLEGDWKGGRLEGLEGTSIGRELEGLNPTSIRRIGSGRTAIGRDGDWKDVDWK